MSNQVSPQGDQQNGAGGGQKGQNPPQGQQYPPGQQQYPPPGQQYPPPGQQYPPPGQQYPPPGQQYPPPGQQYPPGQSYPAAGQQYPPAGGVVQLQPLQGGFGQQAVVWMASPGSIPGCPPGLEYLAQIDQLVVKQQIELLEIVSGFEMENKYRVFNKLGQQVYFAKEESECCMRQCCGPARGFEISITDNTGVEVIRIKRKFKCCAGCCWCAFSDCCAFVVTIESPPGTTVGYVRQECSPWKPNYCLYTVDDDVLARVHGPCCVCNAPCCGDVEFPVMSPDDTNQIGRIAKQWSGAIREWITDADTFSISFPMDMDVRMKAVMMGALFLIDFMYFEQKQNNNRSY